MTSKNEIIEAIVQLNHTATPEFLEEFSVKELTDYLRQLEGVIGAAPVVKSRPAQAGATSQPQPA